ncbi:MAG: hypothetical protein ABR521_03985 [Gaiellaceae bacterium]
MIVAARRTLTLATLTLVVAAGCGGEGRAEQSPVREDTKVGDAGIHTPSRNEYCYAEWGSLWREERVAGPPVSVLECWVFSTAGGPYGFPLSWRLTPRGPALSGRTHHRPLHASPLPYGRTWSGGPFRCRSLRSGLRCWSIVSDHGFVLSRTSQRVF